MTTPDQLTWDLIPPRRPGIDDLGGGEKVQREPFPNPKTQLTAPDVNQWAKQLAALGRVCPALVLSVRFSGGTPVVDTLSPARTTLESSELSLFDNGDGDTTILWSANTLPVTLASPVASLNGMVVGMVCASAVINGVRVRTYRSTAVADDLPFTVMVF